MNSGVGISSQKCGGHHRDTSEAVSSSPGPSPKLRSGALDPVDPAVAAELDHLGPRSRSGDPIPTSTKSASASGLTNTPMNGEMLTLPAELRSFTSQHTVIRPR